MTTIAELRDQVEQNDDVFTTTMEILRDVYGAGKLGVHVRAGISKALASEGLGHYPTELPIYQHEAVRVFKQGTAVADLIEAVLVPNAQHDEELRQKAGGDESTILRQIRELVCQ